MRRIVAIQGCFAVLFAFLLGPFTHVHEPGDHHDPTSSEETVVVHSHVSLDSLEFADSSEPTISMPRHGATHEISMFEFQKASPVQHTPLMAFSVRVSELVFQGLVAEVPEAVAHAPPQLNCIGPRSPPALAL